MQESDQTGATALASDLKLLVRQLRAIDATEVTFRVEGGELVASAQGDDVRRGSRLCRNHYRCVPRCTTEPDPCESWVHHSFAELRVIVPIEGTPRGVGPLVMPVKALAKHLVEKTGRLALKI